MLYLLGKKLSKLFLDGKSIKTAYLDGHKVFDNSEEEEVSFRDLKIIEVIPDEGTWSPAISSNEHLYYWTCTAKEQYVGKIKVRYQYTTRGSNVITKEGMAQVLFSSTSTSYSYLNLSLKVLSSLGNKVIAANNNIIEFNILIWLDSLGNATDVLPSSDTYVGELYKSDNYPNRFVLAREANSEVSTSSNHNYKAAIAILPPGSSTPVVTVKTGMGDAFTIGYEGTATLGAELYATVEDDIETIKTYTSGAESTSHSTSLSDCTVTSNASWCSVGSCNSSTHLCKIIVLTNTEDDREATLTFTKNGMTTQTLKVSLSANPSYCRFDLLAIVEATTADIPASGGSVSTATIKYSYLDNSGNAKTGTESIAITLVTVGSRGTTEGTRVEKSSQTITLKKGENSATETVIVYLAANTKTVNSVAITPSATTVSAAGGNITFASKATYKYTSGSTLDVTITSTDIYNIASNGGNVTLNGNTATFPNRGTATGAARTSTFTATYGGITSPAISVTQSENKVTGKSGERDSSYSVSVSIGNGITAGGGSATITASGSHKHYYKNTYSSGAVDSSESSTTITDTPTLTISSLTFSGSSCSRFSLSGTTLSHSSMTTNVGTDTCTVKATNSTATDTDTVSVVNLKLDPTYENRTFSIDCADIPASGGSIVSGTATYGLVKYENYTAGNKLSLTNVTTGGTVTWSGGVTNCPSLGTSPKSRTKVGTLNATLTLNGNTSTASCDVYLLANSKTATGTSYSYQVASTYAADIPAKGGTSYGKVDVNRATNTEYTWTSGSTSMDVGTYSFIATLQGSPVTVSSLVNTMTDRDKVGTSTVSKSEWGISESIPIYLAENKPHYSTELGSVEGYIANTSAKKGTTNLYMTLYITNITTWDSTYVERAEDATEEQISGSKMTISSIIDTSTNSTASWASAGSALSDSYTISVTENKTSASRTAKVTVKYNSTNYTYEFTLAKADISVSYSDQSATLAANPSSATLPIAGCSNILMYLTAKFTYKVNTTTNGTTTSTTTTEENVDEWVITKDGVTLSSYVVATNAKSSSSHTYKVKAKFNLDGVTYTSNEVTLTLAADSVSSTSTSNRTWTAALLTSVGYNGVGDKELSGSLNSDSTTVFLRVKESYTLTTTWASGETDSSTVSGALVDWNSFKSTISVGGVSWLTVNTSNANDGAAIISVSSNTTNTVRSATISVSYNNSTKSITLNQTGSTASSDDVPPNSSKTKTDDWWAKVDATGAYAGTGSNQTPIYNIVLFKYKIESTSKTYTYSGSITYVKNTPNYDSNGTFTGVTSTTETKDVSGTLNPASDQFTLNSVSYPGKAIIMGIPGCGLSSIDVTVSG